MNRIHRVVVAALSVLLWLLAGAAARAAEVAVANGYTSVVTLKVDKNRLRGELHVRVYSAGGEPQKVPLVYTLSSSGQRLPVQDSKSSTGEGITVFRKAGPMASEVTLVFDAPEGTTADALAGLLDVEDGQPRFSGAIPVTFETPVEPWSEFSPEKVVYNVTLYWPFGSRSIDTTAPGLTLLGSPQQFPRTIFLSSDTGDWLRLSVDEDKQDEDKQKALTATLEDIRAAGTYTGTLLINPTDIAGSPKVEVTVKVQHGWIYPLLTIALGCLLAWCMLKKRELYRPKELLRAQIKSADARYRGDRKKISVKDYYDYDKDFPDPIYSYPTTSSEITDDIVRPYASDLYRKVKGATTTEELNTLAVSVGDFIACINAWKTIQETYGGLSDRRGEAFNFLNKEFTPTTGQYPIRALIEALLISPATPPWRVQDQDGYSLTDTRNNLQEASKTLAYLERGLNLYQDASRKYNQVSHKLTSDDKFRLSPKRNFESGFMNASTDAEFEKAIENLRELDVELNIKCQTHRNGLVALPFPPNFIQVGNANVETGDTRTAEAIFTSIKRMDAVDLLLSTVLAMLAYFVTIYSKGTFGAWHEYLAAFLTGAAGTFLVKGASLATILPWQQSMKVTPAK